MKPINFSKYQIYNSSKQYVLRILGFVCWTSNHCIKQGWFKIFGRGLAWRHEKKGLLFSERNGYTKYWKVGKWYIRFI